MRVTEGRCPRSSTASPPRCLSPNATLVRSTRPMVSMGRRSEVSRWRTRNRSRRGRNADSMATYAATPCTGGGVGPTRRTGGRVSRGSPARSRGPQMARGQTVHARSLRCFPTSATWGYRRRTGGTSAAGTDSRTRQSCRTPKTPRATSPHHRPPLSRMRRTRNSPSMSSRGAGFLDEAAAPWCSVSTSPRYRTRRPAWRTLTQ